VSVPLVRYVSYQVSDYKKCRDFYAGLFGMKVSMDDGMQCRLSFGDNILIVRNRMPNPKVDQIAYTIAGWDTDKSVKPAVEAELKRRGLQIRPPKAASTFRTRKASKFRWAERTSKCQM
jgi:hypothetical protein